MTDQWQDRFIERRMIKAGELATKFNPANFRTHPETQGDATEGSLDKIGWFDAIKFSPTSDKLYDGHLRVTKALEKFGPDYELPVDCYDLTNEETQQALILKDQTSAMAEIDVPKFEAVWNEFQVDIPAFDDWVDYQYFGNDPNDPLKEWEGMPEFYQEDKTSYQSIHVHFKNEDEVREFANLIGQSLTEKTRSIWFSEAEIERYADKRYVNES